MEIFESTIAIGKMLKVDVIDCDDGLDLLFIVNNQPINFDYLPFKLGKLEFESDFAPRNVRLHFCLVPNTPDESISS